MTMLQEQLETIGLASDEALFLANEYGDEPDFFVGLEQVAELISTNTKPKQQAFPPSAQPWKNLYTAILSNGAKPVPALEEILESYAPELAWALSGVIALAVDHIRTRPKRGKGPPKTAEYVQALGHLGYTFKMNECTNRLEVNSKILDDPLAAKIRTQMRDLGFKYVGIMEDAYTAYAWDNRYHPIKDYFFSLRYDGGDHINDLANYFTDRKGVFSVWLRRWLVGAVARVYTGCQNPMLVLVSDKQNVGKSYFCSWLCSSMPEFFIEDAINPDDKDHLVRLAGKWIWEVSELGATTRKADREALKAFITKSWVTVRRAYGRYDMEKPPMASFIGTVNQEAGILSDPTGSRRFVIAHIDKIDWTYSMDMRVDLVWAEAHAAYLNGESHYLTPDELALSEEINKDYEIEDPLEGLLKRHFDIDPTGTGWVPTIDIIRTLEENGLRGNTTGNFMFLARTMRRLGCDRKRRRHNGALVWGYNGVEVIISVP